MVRGDIDMNTAGDFARALDEANGGSVAGVDLTHCGYLDSSAIAVMVRQRAAWGCSFPVLVPEGSFFRRLFDITGVDSLFAIVADPREVED
jgi:anti-anti-sigma factor